ncbi:hypothetical protein [Streptomyces sp. GSL17-111]|uniref:hypothetical protein n=1 Tax=Streptomyces sp. GSL17-111 TaxID=3121596 RepID=UPI0030F469FD
MEIAVSVVSLIFLAFVVLGVIATVKAVRAVRSGVRRTTTEVRKTIDTTALRARSAQFGPVGELARARLELRSSIDSTRRELTAASPGDPSLAEAAALLDRLHEHARGLDREMGALMDREPDRARITAQLPELRSRAQEIRESADSLRFAARDRARRHHGEELGALRDQIAIESGALRHWDPPQQPLTEPAPQPQPLPLSDPPPSPSRPGLRKASDADGG